jgi:hypothetical protein
MKSTKRGTRRVRWGRQGRTDYRIGILAVLIQRLRTETAQAVQSDEHKRRLRELAIALVLSMLYDSTPRTVYMGGWVGQVYQTYRSNLLNRLLHKLTQGVHNER